MWTPFLLFIIIVIFQDKICIILEEIYVYCIGRFISERLVHCTVRNKWCKNYSRLKGENINLKRRIKRLRRPKNEAPVTCSKRPNCPPKFPIISPTVYLGVISLTFGSKNLRCQIKSTEIQKSHKTTYLNILGQQSICY